MIKTTQYVRRPFFVDAVQVTGDNMHDVSEWCGGTVIVDDLPYIKVRVKRPVSPQQTMAYIGDWVLQSDRGFKVYKQSRFDKDFQINNGPSQLDALEEAIVRLESRINNFVD